MDNFFNMNIKGKTNNIKPNKRLNKTIKEMLDN